jgi:hypothetical protein
LGISSAVNPPLIKFAKSLALVMECYSSTIGVYPVNAVASACVNPKSKNF